MTLPTTEVLRQSLQQSEARFQALVAESPDGVLVVGAETIRFFNPAAAGLLGRPAEQLLGAPFPWPLPPGEIREFDLTPQGLPGRVEGRAAPIVWEGASALLVVLRDVSHRRCREEELRRSLRRRDHFLAILSHEMRNPLSAIVNATQLLQRNAADKHALARAVEVLEHQSRQLTRLLDDLLDISRVSEGKIELRQDLVDLRQTVREAAESVAAAMTQRYLTLEVALPEEVLEVAGDPARLLQAVTNLLTNAVKYTEPGGHVWLSAQAEEAQVVLRVRDTGIGIPQDRLESIFEPFFQADSTLARSNGGMGIGLALVRSMVYFHGGTVQAESDGPGRGSTFTVRLPRVEAPPCDVPPSEPTSDISDMRILLVEDNPNARDMLQAVLELEGHEVAVASSGRQGIEMIEFQHPEVALVDIGLPDLDGYELARQIRRHPECDGVRLVALTGYGQPEDRRRALEAGFDAHLVKPVELEQLTDLFHQVRAARPKP